MRGTLCETGANVRCSNLLQLLRDGRALAVVVAALHLDGRLLGQQRVLFASSLTERFAELLRLLLHRLNVGLELGALLLRTLELALAFARSSAIRLELALGRVVALL